jgi:hypothetical protein
MSKMMPGMIGQLRGPQMKIGAALLVVAAIIVGVAITVGDPWSRPINGVGGLCWLVAAGLLALSVRGGERQAIGWLATVGMVVVLVIAIRPSNLVAAILGFSVAGALIAVIMRDRPIRWALLVAAMWLPAHLALAVGRVALHGGGTVRTEPPPTAALVPMAMILAAGAGGLVIVWLRRRFVRGRAANLYAAPGR